MVSPVKTFRRHRKQLLAILTILTVLSFVFVPIFLQILELRRGARNPVVVTTKLYGDLRQSQVSNLLWQRGRWNGFVQRLGQMALERGGRSRRMPVFPESEQEVVYTWLLSRRARDMGITVSDQTINRLIGTLAQERLSTGELKAALKDMGLSQSQLFDIMRNELAALRVLQLLIPNLAGMTPAQRWDYFLRLRRKAEIEAVPIDAEKLLARVPDPSSAEDEKELQALFEPYKDKRADPNSPEPGFREPHRVTLQYFRADLKAFLNPREVTDAAIEAYYKDHQDEFRRWVFPEVKVLPEKPPKPEPGKTPAEKPGPAEKAPAKTSSSKNGSETAFRLVSFQQKEPEKKEPPKPPATQTAPGAAPTAPASPKPEAAAPSTKPAAPKPEAAAPSTKPAAPKPEAAAPKAEAGVPKPGAAPPKGEAPGPSTKEATPKAAKPAEKPESKPGPKLQTQPLDKVKDEIRDILARQKAHERIAAAFAAVQDRMAKFEQAWMAYDALEAKKKEQESPPEPPDVGPIARASGLKPFRVGPISDLEAEPLDIGKSRVEGSIPFVQRAFGQVRLYQAMTSQDSDGNEYLFWKVEDLPERVPNWDDEGVRRRVERAWKLIRARDIAPGGRGPGGQGPAVAQAAQGGHRQAARDGPADAGAVCVADREFSRLPGAAAIEPGHGTGRETAGRVGQRVHGAPLCHAARRRGLDLEPAPNHRVRDSRGEVPAAGDHAVGGICGLPLAHLRPGDALRPGGGQRGMEETTRNRGRIALAPRANPRPHGNGLRGISRLPRLEDHRGQRRQADLDRRRRGRASRSAGPSRPGRCPGCCRRSTSSRC